MQENTLACKTLGLQVLDTILKASNISFQEIFGITFKTDWWVCMFLNTVPIVIL